MLEHILVEVGDLLIFLFLDSRNPLAEWLF